VVTDPVAADPVAADPAAADPVVTAATARAAAAAQPGGGWRGGPRVAQTEIERSRTVIRFPQVEQVHRATIAGAGARPAPKDLVAAATAGPPSELPEHPLPPVDPARLSRSFVEVLRARRSSFGLFCARPALSADELGALLAATGPGCGLRSDVRYPDGGPALARLAVFVNHVDGVPEGAYDYLSDSHALSPIPGDRTNPFLQRQYFLNNYNLEQAAAVLVVVTRPRAVVEAIGDRGYRVVNAEVGAVAQTVYLTAAALGVGCGAALGFDNVALAERLRISGTDQWPMLIIMVGRERHDQADIAYPVI
jgi:SagB-type dehydrogenase family enzyme